MTRKAMTPAALHIGLINNMPDSALEATERQFRTLLCEALCEASCEAHGGRTMRLSLFALPEVPRSDKARHRMGKYASVSALWDTQLDGLIVTGAEPLAAHLTDEPYWASLAHLIDWAQHNTISSVWSCLAAHAAVLRMDGIERRPLGDKLFGVFECANVSEHALTAGMPARLWMPHSRWNDLPEDALSACGYRVLTRSKAAGVDAFVRDGAFVTDGDSLFVFFQGHPEYESDSLLLEYQRDIRRFLKKEQAFCPATPHGHFSDEANTWRPTAVRFYRNWLRYLFDKKYQSLGYRRIHADSAGVETGDGTF